MKKSERRDGMAVNSSRSERGSLLEGATDGKYRKRRPDTEIVPGAGDEKVAANRATLHPEYNYGHVNQELPREQRVAPGT